MTRTQEISKVMQRASIELPDLLCGYSLRATISYSGDLLIDSRCLSPESALQLASWINEMYGENK